MLIRNSLSTAQSAGDECKGDEKGKARRGRTFTSALPPDLKSLSAPRCLHARRARAPARTAPRASLAAPPPEACALRAPGRGPRAEARVSGACRPASRLRQLTQCSVRAALCAAPSVRPRRGDGARRRRSLRRSSAISSPGSGSGSGRVPGASRSVRRPRLGPHATLAARVFASRHAILHARGARRAAPEPDSRACQPSPRMTWAT